MYWLIFLLYASTSLDAAFNNNENAYATSLGNSPPSDAPVANITLLPRLEIQACGAELAKKVKEICSIWRNIGKNMQTHRQPSFLCISFNIALFLQILHF